MDIAKSAGIGFANGSINAAGLPGDVLTGFGYLPKNLLIDLYRMRNFQRPLPQDAPDYLKPWTSESWRQWAEDRFGKFYQPKTTPGRYAETVGEMAPMVIGGEALGAVRGGAAAVETLRNLPWTLVKHAVIPGLAVQGVEQMIPDSKAGQVIQSGYPVVRRVAPYLSAAGRYLRSRRAAP
jgi:hypothetical protein